MLGCGIIDEVIALAHLVLQLLADLFSLTALSIRPRRSLEAEILFLRRQLALLVVIHQAIGALYQGTRHQASTRRCRHSHQLGSALKAVRLALCPGCCATGDLDPLAWSGLASAVAMEVTARTPSDST